MAFSITSSFDSDFYLSQNPDVAAAIEAGLFESAEQHFNQFGFSEGRDPNPYFDTSFYLEQNPDVAAAGINPLNHFNQFGETEGRSPNAIFNPTYYLEQNPDIAASGISPFLHFINHGAGEGRSPNASVASQTSEGFDEAAYLAANPDIADAIASGTFSSGFEHWLLIGFDEGRSGAQNAAGTPIDQPNNSGTPSGDPDGAPSDPDTPVTPGGNTVTPDVIPAAILSASELDLVGLNGTEAVISLVGDRLIVNAANDPSRIQSFALSDVNRIDLNGFSIQMTGDTLDALATALGGQLMTMSGLLSDDGSALNISGVDFGDIKVGALTAPNVAVFDFEGLTAQQLVPTSFTVNGTYGDALKAFWVALDGNYYDALPVQDAEVNTNFLRLGNDYVNFLEDGNAALLDVVQTKSGGTPDYTERQQTLHDNILGNLGESTVTWRVGNGATDVRTELAEEFADRPSVPSGFDNTLEAFQDVKEWDIDGRNGKDFAIDRDDANIVVKIGELSDIASDGNTMWAGSGNSNSDFRIVQIVDQEIELGIKIKERGVGDYPDNLSTDLINESFYDGVSVETGSWAADWSFDFSIATNFDGATTDANAPVLADYQFKLVFDVDPSEAGQSSVTYILDPTDGGNWLYGKADDEDVAELFAEIGLITGNSIIISDNEGEGDSTDPVFVSQNSQNYGFGDSFERYVNTFLDNEYNADGSEIGTVDYWEAGADAGHFSISLQAYDSSGTHLLGTNTIIVDGVVGP
ncbi:hypothetical protein [Roseibium sp.]|uniref:hypothetical protein n=1 Tax=Roseibium sp. TaxID=1936156 RepID=UPI003B50B899